MHPIHPTAERRVKAAFLHYPLSTTHYPLPMLDESNRRTIIALITNGSSRRVAARYVGCAHTTITRTAARDPEFAAQLARAEHSAEISLCA